MIDHCRKSTAWHIVSVDGAVCRIIGLFIGYTVFLAPKRVSIQEFVIFHLFVSRMPHYNVPCNMAKRDRFLKLQQHR